MPYTSTSSRRVVALAQAEEVAHILEASNQSCTRRAANKLSP